MSCISISRESSQIHNLTLGYDLARSEKTAECRSVRSGKESRSHVLTYDDNSRVPETFQARSAQLTHIFESSRKLISQIVIFACTNSLPISHLSTKLGL